MKELEVDDRFIIVDGDAVDMRIGTVSTPPFYVEGELTIKVSNFIPLEVK